MGGREEGASPGVGDLPPGLVRASVVVLWIPLFGVKTPIWDYVTLFRLLDGGLFFLVICFMCKMMRLELFDGNSFCVLQSSRF